MNSNRTPSQKVLARQEKIKAVALELFLTKGYQETSLSDIIKLSGGSYSNIYDSFKSKEGLFFEILDDICKKHFHLIYSKTQEIKNSTLKEILTSFGLAFLEIFNQPEAVAFGKIVYSQVYDKDRHLANWMENNQQNFSYNILMDFFKQQNNSYMKKNAEKLAVLFYTMLKEPYHHLNVLINAPLKNKKEQKEHVEFVVNVFLNGINGSKA
ncbi:TPA: multidrug efflux system transcriptional regulator CmeR [Campylobacter jejuni]|nr:multidrug efflux system transcriptional regulator CmeR [Campylobacter jejuni]ECK7650627.1 multidrug efflux system transcriptional regulator CmeR [Campylobacter jejuni]ECK7661571.1 multidrug efflux system transcriptional regulator CmeR [Campylobacter jejuni]ECK7792190.1 multidrug efflux system transcriptional regulator CmeR [Campylobacter jejuni]ECK7792951.1 multidrug efflux system transcriptional regulator CmeR [Campylobacter jejuni]